MQYNIWTEVDGQLYEGRFRDLFFTVHNCNLRLTLKLKNTGKVTRKVKNRSMEHNILLSEYTF